MLSPGSLVDIYDRASTDDQEETLKAQDALNRATVERLGLRLNRVVVDKGETSTTLERPGMREIIARLEAGEIRGVVVSTKDRLTRDVVDAGYLVKRFFTAEGGAWLIAEGSYVDTRTANGRFVFFLMVLLSQFYREVLVENTRRVLKHKRKAGERLGRDKLGWKTDPDNPARSKTKRPIGLVVDHEDLATIERIRHLRQLGFTMRKICQVLDEEGRTPKRSERWSVSTIGQILKPREVPDVQPEASTAER